MNARRGLGVVAFVVVAALALWPAVRGLFSEQPQDPPPLLAGERWGAGYFPNVELTSHEGKSYRFFDDLIQGKVVMINFIYTSCPDSCPLETARLAEVARILGDRVGKDVFIYSISIDPETDTPQVLARYAERYEAMPGWLFFTGDEREIVALRKKLGLYIAEIQSDDSNDHNLSLIIGNQATGRWMKRSPFENPHVLATQVGSWLHGWKAPPAAQREFAQAPTLRPISDGERLFRTRCAACHKIGEQTVGTSVVVDAARLGPDLQDVTERREGAWLKRWLKEPDVMLRDKDPLAMKLFAEYREVPMPNMRLSDEDVHALLQFLRAESRRRRGRGQPSVHHASSMAVHNPWIREAHPSARVHAGYMTVQNQGQQERTLLSAHSDAYEKVEMHQMRNTGDGMRMLPLARLRIGAGEQAQFAPRGSHLMLIGPRKPLQRGQAVSVRLTFAEGEPATMVVPFEVWPDAPLLQPVAERVRERPSRKPR